MGKKKGIFCLEGDWSRNLARPSSVEPILNLLSRWEPYFVRYIHRDVSTQQSLEGYLRQWLQRRYDNFPILYLASHGIPGVVCLNDVCSDKFTISLKFLEDVLRGRCAGRIIYFGSCSTLKVPAARLNRFLETTGALAICGYSKEADWLSSTAFELLVMGAMQQNAFTVSGVRAMNRRITERSRTLARRLGFKMVIRKPV